MPYVPGDAHVYQRTWSLSVYLVACDVFNGSSPSHGYLIVRPSNFYKIVFDIEIFIQVINLQSNDGLAWNCSITSAYALEILQYCAKPTI